MNVLDHFKKVTTFVLDVDGVLTDGTILVLENGLQARRMSIKDGFALQMAIKNGFRVVIVSGGQSDPVTDRLQKLGITDVNMSVADKKEFFLSYLNDNKLQWSEVLYMGDDLPDLELLKVAGLSCCPADAIIEIREAVTYISPYRGGEGCVRDVIEKVLKLNDKWNYNTSVASR
jgi:3-deoxy-D-manno-octulosonate 8-phosphate phosphatase (KDO 8-P phosphatase)